MPYVLHEVLFQLWLLLLYEVQSVLVYITARHALFDEGKKVCLKRYEEVVDGFLLL